MTRDTPHAEQPGLADYVAILNRRKWVVVQSVLIVAVVAFLLSARQEKVFQASAEVLLNRQNISNIVTGVSSPDIYVDPTRFMDTQAGLARAPEVARRAVTLADVDRTAGDLLASSNVSPKSNADLLRFTVSDGEPGVATTLANAYATAFTTYKADLDTSRIVRARRDLEARLVELRANGQSGSDAYQELVKNAQQLRTMELLQERNVVVRPATGAGQIAPTPKRSAMLGAALGLVLGLGIAFLWEALDKRVRKEEEIEQVLDLPIIGTLPPPSGKDAVTMIDEPKGAHAEATRLLRTNLEFANVDRDAVVVMLTSAVEQEGKSTTSANLAVALARSGKNVVLVDLDLRRPTLATLFGLEGQPGISDVVLGRTELRNALAPVSLPVPLTTTALGSALAGTGKMLRVLPSGRVPASPGEFVGTQALARVIDQLRQEFDYVIVDSAPLLPVGDSLRLSAVVDGILVVTRLGVIDRKMLSELKRTLDVSPAHKLGIVVTGAGAGDSYRYGYQYGDSEPELRAAPIRTPAGSEGNGSADDARRLQTRKARRATSR